MQKCKFCGRDVPDNKYNRRHSPSQCEDITACVLEAKRIRETQPAGLTFNVQHIRDRIAVIDALAKTGDFEAAWSSECDLYRDSLFLIRDGKFTNNTEIADETLKVGLLSYPRHCA
jgi:hypothetical protein